MSRRTTWCVDDSLSGEVMQARHRPPRRVRQPMCFNDGSSHGQEAVTPHGMPPKVPVAITVCYLPLISLSYCTDQ